MKYESRKLILLVIDAFSPGGAQRNIQLLIPEWLKLGYSVSLVLLQDHPNELELDFVESEHFTVTRIKAQSISDLRAFIRFSIILRNRRPTLVIANLYWSQLWSSLSKPFSSSLIWVEHNTYLSRTRIKWGVYQLLSLRTSHILAVSQEIRSFLRHQKITKVELIKNSVQPYIDALDFENRDNVFLFIGRLVPQKNPQLALRAFLEALDENLIDPKSKLLIIGHGELKKNLLEISRTHKNSSQVEFLGFLNREAVRDYLRSSRVLLLSSRFEGLPIARLEALEFGLCHVTTSTSGMRDLFEFDSMGAITTPGIVIADEKERFKAGIAQVMSTQFQTSESAGIRKNLVKNFYPDAVAQDYLKFLN